MGYWEKYTNKVLSCKLPAFAYINSSGTMEVYVFLPLWKKIFFLLLPNRTEKIWFAAPFSWFTGTLGACDPLCPPPPSMGPIYSVLPPLYPALYGSRILHPHTSKSKSRVRDFRVALEVWLNTCCGNLVKKGLRFGLRPVVLLRNFRC